MTKEKRIIFGIPDLKKIRIVCRGCGNEVAYQVSRATLPLPDKCPLCESLWKLDNTNRPEYRYLESIRELILTDDSLAIDFKMEIEEEA